MLRWGGAPGEGGVPDEDLVVAVMGCWCGVVAPSSTALSSTTGSVSWLLLELFSVLSTSRGDNIISRQHYTRADVTNRFSVLIYKILADNRPLHIVVYREIGGIALAYLRPVYGLYKAIIRPSSPLC